MWGLLKECHLTLAELERRVKGRGQDLVLPFSSELMELKTKIGEEEGSGQTDTHTHSSLLGPLRTGQRRWASRADTSTDLQNRTSSRGAGAEDRTRCP